MKKIISILLCMFLITATMTGCVGSSNNDSNTDKLNIVTTIFPEYDWVREILGENSDDVEITLLLDNGVDLHSYQPTADDLIKISTCDLFIYVGGESDEWVDDALKNAVNSDMKIINLLTTLGGAVKTEETVEGMEKDDDEHDDELENDEHVWLSLKNAETICNKICEELQTIDPDNKDLYSKNASAYIEKLSDLDTKYKAAVNEGKHKTILFGDRFPFRYLTDDYGLKYYAAFVGCSAETEASFETVSFLASKVDELELSCVLTLDGTRQKIAETVIQNTQTKDQKILEMDSMQSTTSKDVENGVTYLSIMEKNLSVLIEALG